MFFVIRTIDVKPNNGVVLLINIATLHQPFHFFTLIPKLQLKHSPLFSFPTATWLSLAHSEVGTDRTKCSNVAHHKSKASISYIGIQVLYASQYWKTIIWYNLGLYNLYLWLNLPHVKNRVYTSNLSAMFFCILLVRDLF